MAIALSLTSSVGLRAQEMNLPSAPFQRKSAYDWRSASENNNLAGSWKSENIGPTIMSGRITDIDVNPDNGHEFYIAYASGGLWYTKNNGTTFTPVFDHEAVMTIGDIAVHWPSHTLYVGSGESNSSRSSYAGNGIYMSTDKGKTWKNIGLEDSHHIGRMWVDPRNANKLMVAAMGHLYTKNKERGLFLTEDAGKTWIHSFAIDDSTGVIDLIADPTESNTFYCTSWHRQRKAWNFMGAGTTSAIYKSTDGGMSWKDISISGSGFPRSEYTGRIGITAAQRDGKTVLFTIVDNQSPKEKTKKTAKGLTKEKIRAMTVDSFLQLSDDTLTKFLKDNDFPEKYNSKELKKQVKKGKLEVKALADYLEDANMALFDTDIAGAEIYKSEDGGNSWTKTHTEVMKGLYYTYGYYFGQITAQADDPKKLYILGVPLLKSEDEGKTWKDINGDNQHGDHHVLFVHPKNPDLLYNGNDGGLNISYDGGSSWIKCNMPAVGQFYAIQTDNESPYNVYGGLQDNGVWTGNSQYKYSTAWQSNGDYPYKYLLGGDGMQVQVDPRDHQTVYTGYQFGNYFRIDKKSGDRKFITPKHELGDRPYRWNWQSPILLSRHQPDILYMGANKLLRSFDKGDHFKALSGDLTHGGQKGNVPYGTLTCIEESPLTFGLLYTGSDDGKVCRSKDGGITWDTISNSLPRGLWVSRLTASKHSEARVYVSLNGYRSDDFSPYLYSSDDYGKIWTSLSQGLPHEAVNVMREDPENEDMLYVGTDHGVYMSLDRGLSFQRIDLSLPNVPVHDLAIQQKGEEMVIGTHGRSLFKMNISDLRRLAEWKDSLLVIGNIPNLNINTQWGKKRTPYDEVRQPKVKFSVFSKAGVKANLTIESESGQSFSKEVDLPQGISVLETSFWFDAMPVAEKTKQDKKKGKETKIPKVEPASDDGHYYPVAGNYTLKLKIPSKEKSGTFKVEARKK